MNKFAKHLINWYKHNGRKLPWRETRDPYTIWVSEIILQQTRISQGTAYFHRFIERYPNVSELASADEHDVLKLWQGLGYYSRARNMLAAAKQVMNLFEGQFPRTYKGLLQLRGVGEYTAGAIASIAYNLPHAAVDGNALRVLSRFYAIDTPISSTKGKKLFSQLATEMVPKEAPGMFNQAIMDFGAMQCTPRSPDCPSCSLADMCLAYIKNRVQNYPVKEKKAKVRDRYMHYLFIRYKDDRLWLEKRNGQDIWKNMYQLPLIESYEILLPEQVLRSKEWQTIFYNAQVEVRSVSNEIIHMLSHRKIHAFFYEIQLIKGEVQHPAKPVYLKDIFNFAIPKLIENYLTEKIQITQSV
ncbi:A/G-specific adenine glycosylase [Prolixibacter sp. SD074]|uniref:A/G-specific adenine glycosylase n=1 Tax=Prolixibacter sp. SD074 TaxID=2652391 RepID=UPI001280B2F9|nr:A/G-specific adenine glycosylase [Prolixibacter sp. SD074]GET27960.1 A/G-specific adenine glycosylase [Prolixibacter sp. SD074]